MRIRRTALLAASLLLAIGAITASAVAGPASSGEEPSQVAKSKKGKKKAKQAAKKLTKAVKDSRLVGTRGDGASVDSTFCANGKFRSQIDGATAPGKSWKIVEAIKKGKKLEGSIKGKAGFRVAVIKKGSKWQFGIAFPGAGGRSFGPVTRSDAKAECATL